MDGGTRSVVPLEHSWGAAGGAVYGGILYVYLGALLREANRVVTGSFCGVSQSSSVLLEVYT